MERLLLLLYAYYAVFLSYSRTDIREKLNLLAEHCSTNSLTVDVTKTKAIIFLRSNYPRKLRPLILNNKLEYYKMFTSLGIPFASSSKFVQAVHVSVSKTFYIFQNLISGSPKYFISFLGSPCIPLKSGLVAIFLLLDSFLLQFFKSLLY